MKKIIRLLVIGFLFVSCGDDCQEEQMAIIDKYDALVQAVRDREIVDYDQISRLLEEKKKRLEEACD